MFVQKSRAGDEEKTRKKWHISQETETAEEWKSGRKIFEKKTLAIFPSLFFEIYSQNDRLPPKVWSLNVACFNYDTNRKQSGNNL